MQKQKAILIVLDGFGEGKHYKGNAIWKAKMPFFTKLRKNYPSTLLDTSGNAVGLPKGGMGGSEVGHFTMGAGRIVWQPRENISQSIRTGSFFKNKVIVEAMKKAKERKALHLIGMISGAGIHADIAHVEALLSMAKQKKVAEVYVHAIADGRDVEPHSVEKFLTQLKRLYKKHGVGKTVDLIGRYYAMDRDNNWDRTQIAYDLYTNGGQAKQTKNFMEEVRAYYEHTETELANDYYLPAIIDEATGKESRIQKNDVVIFFNFRTDRAKQLTAYFVEKSFKKAPRKTFLAPHFVCYGSYSDKAPNAFAQKEITNNLGEVLAKEGLSQARIAETEKYAHVTYFFNSEKEKPFPKEKRILVPSPKVASYAQKPEMSAREITTETLKVLENKKSPDFILINFANCDLVGHSGNMSATIKACEVIDECLDNIITTAKEKGYAVIITADHGNADYMLYEKNGKSCPSHSMNPVPCVIVSHYGKAISVKKKGGLYDVAPTLLALIGVKKPKEMTGTALYAIKK